MPSGSEIIFERRAYANNTSTYHVSGNTIPESVYKDALRGIGVDTRSHNFLVFQGDVQKLADKEPLAMLKYFEEFSGSDEYKENYEELQNKLKELNIQYNEKRTERSNAHKEVMSFKDQIKSTEIYNRLLTDITQYKVQQKLLQLFYIDTNITVNEAKLTNARKEFDDVANQETTFSKQWAELGRTASTANQNKGKYNSQVQSKAKEARDRTEKVRKLEIDIENARKIISEGSNSEKKADDAVTVVKNEVETLDSEIATVEAQLHQLQQNSDSSSSSSSTSVALADTDRTEYNKLKATERQQTADNRDKLDRLLQANEGDEMERDKHKANLEAGKSRITVLEQQLENYKNRKQELENALAESNKTKALKQDDISNYNQELIKVTERQETIGKDLEDVQATLASYSALKNKTDTEKRMEQAVEDLKRLFSGVRGRVIDLVEPLNPKYTLAVSITLGRHADAIVVDTQAVAFDCIQWLRDNKIRQMLFLPLDTLHPPEISDDILAIVSGPRNNKTYQLARDIIRFSEENLEKAVHFACGNTLVCEKLEDAMTLRYQRNIQCKVVTYDGSIISKNANMTGGAGDDNLNRGVARFDEKAMRKAEQRRNELLGEEEKLRRRLAKHRGPADQQSLYSLIEGANNDMNTLTSRIGQVTKAIEQQTNLLNSTMKELETLRIDVQKAEEGYNKANTLITQRMVQIDELRTTINKVADTIFKDFTARLKLHSIRDYESQVLERQAAEAKKRQILSENLEKLRSKLDFEKRKLDDAQKALERTRKEASEAGTKFSQYEKELLTAKQELENTKTEEASLRSKLEEANKTETQANNKRDELSKKRDELLKEKTKKAKEVSNIELLLETYRTDRHYRLTQAQTENIVLPRKVSIKYE